MAKILIVNKDDKVIGAEEMKVVQAKGLIHRIVRIFLFNLKGQLFLQRRAVTMDTFPNRWDQSVGGHVDEGEDYHHAAIREMKEELGVKSIKLEKVIKFYHEEHIENKVLKRFNMLYEGVYDGKINLNKLEVSDGKWFELKDLEVLIGENPNDFTPAFIKTYQIYKKEKRKDD